MQSIRKILATNIKLLRKNKNISQEQLGFLSGLHRTYISDIECERRNVSIENIEKIAKVLNVQPYKLLIDESIKED